MGPIGCFSFFPSKNLGAFGDGGLVTTNDAALAHEVALLRNHGAEPKYFHKRIGGNFRLDALQAAVLRVKLPHLPGGRTAGAPTPAISRLFARARGRGPGDAADRTAGYHHIYNQFVIRVPDRDRPRAISPRAASGPRSTTRCRSISRSASPGSDTPRGVPARRTRRDVQPRAPDLCGAHRSAAGGGRRGTREGPRPLMRLR